MSSAIEMLNITTYADEREWPGSAYLYRDQAKEELEPRIFVIDGEEIIVKPEHVPLLGKTVDDLREKLQARGVGYSRLVVFDAHTRENYGISAIDYLFILNQHSLSLRQLSKRVNISEPTIKKYLQLLDLPIVSGKEASLRAYTPEQRSAMKAAYWGNLSAEERRAAAIRVTQALTPEQRSDAVRRGRARMTAEQRREIALKGWSGLTEEEHSERARRTAEAVDPQNRRAGAMRFWGRLTPGQRSEHGMKARSVIEARSNNVEKIVIGILQDAGLYAESALDASFGQVYAADTTKDNRRPIKLTDGRFKLPDFKVKGQRRVIEVYGGYYHSEAFGRSKNRPDYHWDAARMQEEYAKVDYDCLVIWESDLLDSALREQTRDRILDFVRGSSR